MNEKLSYDELKKRVAELEQQVEKFRAIYENVNDAVYIHKILPSGEPGKFLEFNKSAVEMLGYTSEELKSLSLKELDDPEKKSQYFPKVMEQLQQEKSAKFEAVQIAKNGRSIIVEVNAVVTEIGGDEFILSVYRDISERKKAEEALNNSKALLDATGRMAKVGGWELSADTLEVAWTDETYRIHEVPLGHKPPLREAINFFHPKDRPLLERAIQRALDHGEPYDMEIRFITARGKHLWTRTICEPEIVEGKTVKLKGTFQDITDRKLAEMALQESENKLKLAQRIGKIGNWSWEIDPDRTEWSDQVYEIFKAPRKKPSCVFAKAFVYPEDLNLWETTVQNAIKNKNPFKLDYRAVRTDGKVIWVHNESVSVTDDNGDIIGYQGTVQDITERKKTEIALHESESKYRMLFDNAVDAIFVADSDTGILVDVNKKAEELTGYSKSELIGKHQTFIHPSEDSEYYNQEFKKASESEGAMLREMLIQTKYGQYISVEINSGGSIQLDSKRLYIGSFRNITKRKLAEENLLKTSRRLQQAHKMAKLGHWDWEMSTGELTWSDEVYEIFGRDKQTFYPTAESFEACIHPNDLQEFISEREAALMQNRAVEIKHRIILPDGSISHVQELAEIIRNNNGDLIRMSGTVQDITGIIRIEEQLRLTLDATTDGIWTWNFKTNELNFSPKYYTMLGYEQGAFHANYDNWVNLIHPDDREKAIAVATEYIKTKPDSYENEFRLKTQNGDYRWIHARARVVERDEKGDAVYMIGNHEDITERKQAEEALRESERKLHAILDHHYQLTGLIDIEGRILAANCTALNFVGVNDSEVIGRYLWDSPWWEPSQKSELRKAIERAGRGEFIRYETTHLNAEGEIRNIDFSLTPVRNDDGNVIYIVPEGRDITEMKRAEEHRALLQKQLNQAQRMESIGTLAGGIAHNFNNILMGIQGRTSLMKIDKGSSHPDYEHLKGIEDSVCSAVELTRDLLGFARGGKYQVKPTDLNELIKRENRTFGRTTKEVKIHGKYEGKLWTVEIDRGQIQQALLNLYVNAWQAMPNGGDLYIQTKNALLDEECVKPFNIAPGRYVKVSVTDNGTGMDSTILDKIFDPFFSTKDIGQGSGLGLASVYGIIKNHNGCINVFSEKGEGTTFNIYLPASEKKIVEDGAKPDRHKIAYGQGTILLVDDEDMIIDVGQKMLEHLGYRVLIARSGKEALDIYGKKKEEIRLVILDMILPGMGGGDTYDLLKRIDEHVRVLLSSGYSINGKGKEILERGCIGFIQKPYSLEDLSIKIKKTLEETEG